MAETRAQIALKETAIREVEDDIQKKFQQLFEDHRREIDEKFDKSIAELFEAVKMITKAGGISSSGGGDRVNSPGLQANTVPSPPIQEVHRGRTGNSNLGYSGLTRLSKIDFPRFNGERVKDWMFKIEQFFLIDHTPDDLKISLASIHFDEQAASWHQSLMQSEYGRAMLLDWKGYKELLLERFGEVIDDPIAELKNLHETEGIMDYHNKFEVIRTRVTLPEEYLVSAYLPGLRQDTQMHVRMFQPQSIRQCLLLGKLYETAHPRRGFSSTSQSGFRIGGNQGRGILPFKKENAGEQRK